MQLYMSYVWSKAAKEQVDSNIKGGVGAPGGTEVEASYTRLQSDSDTVTQ